MTLFMNNEDFMTNEEILEYLNSFANPTNEFKEWFKPPQQIGNFPFFEVIDRFVTYLYTTDKRDLPFTSISSIDLDEKNQFLLNDNGTLIYLTSPPPFVENFVYTVTMTQENAYFVSNLNFCTAEKEGYPSIGTDVELVELIKKDLAKTDPQILKVTFDGEEVIGSFIVRKKFLEIKSTLISITGLESLLRELLQVQIIQFMLCMADFGFPSLKNHLHQEIISLQWKIDH